MNRKEHAKWLRIARKIHRVMGATLFFLFVLIAITGLALGWKKNSNEVIMPGTQQGTSDELEDWLSFDSLQRIALETKTTSSVAIDRLDVRPDKGIVKVIFNDFSEIQLDGVTGSVLSQGTRHSDWIEHLHDGSLFDDMLGTSFIKLVYTSASGIALLIFTITGFWLWYGPKAMRRAGNR
jgi:uncharacterized iron-regulated membrane protein